MKYLQKARWITVALAIIAILFAGCTNPNDNTEPLVSVEGITLNNSAEKSLTVGQSFELTAAITPDNASDKRIIWRSLQPNVAMVFADGLSVTVTAITPGTTLILAVTEDGGKLASCPVKVQ